MYDREKLREQHILRVSQLARTGGIKAVVDDFVMAEALNLPPVMGGQETLARVINEKVWPTSDEEIYCLDKMLFIHHRQTLWMVVSSHVLEQMMKTQNSCQGWLDVLLTKEDLFYAGFERWARRLNFDNFTLYQESFRNTQDWERVWELVWDDGRSTTDEHSLGLALCWILAGQKTLSGAQAGRMWAIAREKYLPEETAGLIKKAALRVYGGREIEDEPQTSPLM